MNVDTWAVVLATFAGPIVAVLITRWNDERRERRGRLLQIYRTLMATRRTNISLDHVTAINLIEVEFDGIPAVIDAWTAYLNHLNSGVPESAPHEQHRTWIERRAELLAILLAKIAKYLGITKGEIEILHGGYAPQAWAFREERLDALQEYVLRLSRGQAVLPMTTTQAMEAPNPYPPAPSE